MMFEAGRLSELLRYEPDTGKLFWHYRDRDWFASDRIFNAWNARCAGKPAFTAIDGRGYYSGSVLGVSAAAHRVIWAVVEGYWPDEIDHVNGQRTDNRWVNLREVTSLGNQRNTRCPARNTSGHIGVGRYAASPRWKAYIGLGGKHVHLGMFDTFDEAVTARKAAERQYGFHENHGRKDL